MKKLKKMPKVLICLLSVCMLSLGLLPVRVHADVLLEPDDSFWEAHQRDCDYLNRAYTVNGEQGYAFVWESPISSRQKEVLANGTKIWSRWHYIDGKGETWCAIMTGEVNNRGYEKVSGWIKTSDCLVIPDYISFQEAHGEEFVEYDQAYGKALEEAEKMVLWKYPCSGQIVADDMDVDAEWFEGRSFGACWEDPQGRMWAYVGYCYGIRNTWVCLDDPSNTELEADETVLPQTETIYPAAERLPAVKNGITGMTIAAVSAVVAVTGVLLRVFFVRKRRETA